MKNFHGNRGGGGNRFGGGGRNFGGGGSFNRTQERSEMHDAVCATCHQNCQVPFRPTGSKPVYCRECFNRDGDQSRSPRFGGGGGGRSDERGFTRQEKQIFYVTCDKCGVDCDVPFKPNGSKPVYCRGCFDKGGDSSGAPRRDSHASAPVSNGPSYAKQFSELNAKLDMLIDLITEAAEDFDEDADLEEEVVSETDNSIEEAAHEVVAEVATEATEVVEEVTEVTSETPEEIVAKVVEDIDDLGDFDSIK